MLRPTWDDTCVAMLWPLEQRSTCYKHHVGALLFNPLTKKIVEVGYNGAPHGMPHCTPENAIMDGPHHINDIHAETNVIVAAGERAAGCTLYCSLTPCRRCAILCVQAKISRFVFVQEYNISGTTDFDFVYYLFKGANIEFSEYRTTALPADRDSGREDGQGACNTRWHRTSDVFIP